mgnify:FL=1
MVRARGWFAGRAPDVQARLAGIARARRHAAGAVTYREGDAPDGLHGLIAGEIELAFPSDAGEEFALHRAEPGYWIGDLALFSGARRLVTVRAVTDAETLFLPARAVRDLIEADPALIEDFYALSHENTRLALRLIAMLGQQSSERRVALWLLLHDEHVGTGEWLRTPRREIASLTGLSEPTVGRILRRFGEAGLIALDYGRIRVLDRDRFERFCRTT